MQNLISQHIAGSVSQHSGRPADFSLYDIFSHLIVFGDLYNTPNAAWTKRFSDHPGLCGKFCDTLSVRVESEPGGLNHGGFACTACPDDAG
jgi:hypothetical protein